MSQEEEVLRPRRSVLYMPASRASALEKAKSLPADALIFDLEDAVAPDAKADARGMAVQAALSGEYGRREIAIRANGLDTPWGKEDLQAIAQSGAHAVVIPKVESTKMLEEAAQILADSGAPENLWLWAMIETPKGVLRVEEIAANSKLTVLVMGTSDLAVDLTANHTPERIPFFTSFGLVLLAARAHGRSVLDGVHLNLADDEEFEVHCQQAVDMGFDGKTLIHPKQVAPANAWFGPDPKAVENAEKVVEAYETAIATGQGVATLDGKLIENLHAVQARRILAKAAAIKALGN
ncbi:MAG: HpcH/HpaI aldolase/citrate lyase family protein [Alphaproteobacteria bacterium]